MNKRISTAVFTAALIVGAVACAAPFKSGTANSFFYPHPGFGRVGCYAGADLSWRNDRSSSADDSPAAIGPWLILDSMSRDEYVRAVPDIDPRPNELRSATMLQMRDTLTWIGGFWSRIAPDSIIFREASTFPGTVWRFASTSSGLVGQGITVSDLRVRTADGRDSGIVTIRPAQATKISCAQVPKRPPGWPQAPEPLPAEPTTPHGPP